MYVYIYIHVRMCAMSAPDMQCAHLSLELHAHPAPASLARLSFPSLTSFPLPPLPLLVIFLHPASSPPSLPLGLLAVWARTRWPLQGLTADNERQAVELGYYIYSLK